MNTSSMVKDNPYVIPPGESIKGSSERSRLSRDFYVKYDDVLPDCDVGHIAVGSCSDGQEIAPLRRKRFCC